MSDPMGPAMDITVHWANGGTTTVPSNHATAMQVIELMQGSSPHIILASDEGQAPWLLCGEKGGDGIVGVSAKMTDADAQVTLGRKLVDDARPIMAALIGMLQERLSSLDPSVRNADTECAAFRLLNILSQERTKRSRHRWKSSPT